MKPMHIASAVVAALLVVLLWREHRFAAQIEALRAVARPDAPLLRTVLTRTNSQRVAAQPAHAKVLPDETIPEMAARLF